MLVGWIVPAVIVNPPLKVFIPDKLVCPLPVPIVSGAVPVMLPFKVVFGVISVQVDPVARVMFLFVETPPGKLKVAVFPLLPKIIGRVLFPKTPFAELLFTPVTASVPSKIRHCPV